jgi:hypothetical protein
MNNIRNKCIISCKTQRRRPIALMQAPILIHWIRLEEIYCFTVKTKND